MALIYLSSQLKYTMTKFRATLLFYAIAFTAIYLLFRVSPSQHDGSPGLGASAFMIFTMIVAILFVMNIYKGIRIHKQYFLIAAVHLLVLIWGGSRLFS